MKKLKKLNKDMDKLMRDKNSTPEARMDWLYNALIFSLAPKKILYCSAFIF
ncbi:MAG: hypothetical protein UR27_C0018G0010 [Candidatus Peregrinibacteria bacterium GW2011_GWA2_33_10]|nr:MAG: hypothetical protein UR27_C0018G0010 [Candidatus Peregrinibacteria bacterium GW2011_GWA2_33_10]KKP38776.1 MAG: hypothetical protein UR30_C0015G0009 [Candidatus Peregrinibacteria bacterium GW2011_GWC2_33_13]